jgi:hypothetical protein
MGERDASDDAVARTARTAAQRLASEYGPRLEADVEVALHGSGTRRADQYVDPISIATLIVTAAQLGWTVYNDIHKEKLSPPLAEVVSRRIRLELHTDIGAFASQRNHVIDVVVDDIVSRPPND